MNAGDLYAAGLTSADNDLDMLLSYLARPSEHDRSV
jgi:hypothetical protein